MKKVLVASFGVLVFIYGASGQSLQRHKIAIFAPLYLDSAFDGSGKFRVDKNDTKFYNPGLEFYYGAQLALDSLDKRGAPLEAYIFDSRSRESINQQLNRPDLKDLELIIAESNAAETRQLAEAASRRKVPFISATLPNDAGVINNPYFVVLNTTLLAHIEGIYHFLQRYHRSDKIIVFRKPGPQEDQIKNYLMEDTRSTSSSPLNIKYVDLPDNFTSKTLAGSMDSTLKNVCIVGSLDANFGMRVTSELADLSHTYTTTVIGMPTWESMNFNRANYNGLEIVYSTPFFYNRTTPLEADLATDFNRQISSKPSDLFFRGYETTLRFGLLLLESKKDLPSNLTRKGNTVITQFDIQPVFKDKTAMNLDYFENKHLYFIRVLNGVKNVLY